MSSLSEKTAVVTGGGSGIGQAISLLFAAEGAHVHIVELNEAGAAGTVQTIEKAGGKATAHACNVADGQAVAAVFEGIGPVHILVNNAGIAHVGTVEQTTEADLDRVYSVNIKGVFNCIAAAIGGFKQRGGGVILNICLLYTSPSPRD